MMKSQREFRIWSGIRLANCLVLVLTVAQACLFRQMAVKPRNATPAHPRLTHANLVSKSNPVRIRNTYASSAAQSLPADLTNQLWWILFSESSYDNWACILSISWFQWKGSHRPIGHIYTRDTYWGPLIHVTMQVSLGRFFRQTVLGCHGVSAHHASMIGCRSSCASNLALGRLIFLERWDEMRTSDLKISRAAERTDPNKK
jgi:hypothetical protein